MKKQRKIWFFALIVVMVCGVVNGQQKKQPLPLPDKLKEFQDKLIENEIGIVLPPKKPEVKEQLKKELLINKDYKKFIELHAETEKLFIERQKYLTTLDPKEKRHSEPKIKALEKQILQKRKKFYQEANHLRKPMEQKYMKMKTEYDDLKKKVFKAKRDGKDAYATKCSEEATVLERKLIGSQEPIDVLNSFLFFNEYYPIEDDKDMKKANDIASYDIKKLQNMYNNQKNLKMMKQKSEKKD